MKLLPQIPHLQYIFFFMFNLFLNITELFFDDHQNKNMQIIGYIHSAATFVLIHKLEQMTHSSLMSHLRLLCVLWLIGGKWNIKKK